MANYVHVSTIVGPPNNTDYLCTYVSDKSSGKWSFGIISSSDKSQTQHKYWNMSVTFDVLQKLVSISQAKNEAEYLDIFKSSLSNGDVKITLTANDELHVSVGGTLEVVLARCESVCVSDMYSVCLSVMHERQQLEQKVKALQKQVNSLESEQRLKDRLTTDTNSSSNGSRQHVASPAKGVIRQPGMSLINPQVKKVTMKDKGVKYDE